LAKVARCVPPGPGAGWTQRAFRSQTRLAPEKHGHPTRTVVINNSYDDMQ